MQSSPAKTKCVTFDTSAGSSITRLALPIVCPSDLSPLINAVCAHSQWLITSAWCAALFAAITIIPESEEEKKVKEKRKKRHQESEAEVPFEVPLQKTTDRRWLKRSQANFATLQS